MANIGIDSTWVRDRFNLQYNDIFSNKAPGLEDYELSMYLTMAHLEVIDKYSGSLDLFEKNRSILSAYIYDKIISGTIATTTTRGLDYQIFTFEDDCWKILTEYITTVSNPSGFGIVPTTYDKINNISGNPNRIPNGLKGYRLDVNSDPSSVTAEKRDVKIIFKKSNITDYITKYEVVYLATPSSFDLESNNIPKTLTNNPFLTEKIINRAVELSTRDYKENSLQAQVQTNTRSE